MYFLNIFVLLLGCATTSHNVTRSLIEGNQAALKGDFGASIKSYEQALTRIPDYPPAIRNLGIVLVKVGDFERAQKLLTQVLPHYPKDVDTFYHLGEAHRGLGKNQIAIQNYEQAVTLAPNDLRVLKALAWTHQRQKNYSKTLEMVTPLLKKHPNDLQLKLIAANTLNKVRHFSKTKELLEPLERAEFKIQSQDKITADTERVLLKLALADAYLGMNTCDKALTLFQAILSERPFLSSALTGAAKCDMQQQRHDRAISRLERATKSDPDAVEAHFLLGRLYESKDAQRSAFNYRRFLLLSKGNNEFSNETNATKNALYSLERRQRNNK